MPAIAILNSADAGEHGGVVGLADGLVGRMFTTLPAVWFTRHHPAGTFVVDGGLMTGCSPIRTG